MTQDELGEVIEGLSRLASSRYSKGSRRKSTVVNREGKFAKEQERRKLEQMKIDTIKQRKQEAEDRRKRGRFLRPIEKEKEK